MSAPVPSAEPSSGEARLRRLIDGLFSFVGLLDTEGIILEANRTALDAAGLNREDVIGRPVWETRWFAAGPQVQAQLRAAIARARMGETMRYDVDICLAGDETIRMDFQLVPLIEDGRVTGIVPSGIDVTAGRDGGEQLLAFAQFAQALAIASHAEDVAAAVCTHLARSLGASFANLAMVEPSARSVQLVHPSSLDAAIVEHYVEIPLDTSTPLTDAIRTKRTVIVENARAYEERYPLLADDTRAAGLSSTASVPLEFGDVVLGAIGVGWSQPLHMDGSFHARLEAVARLTAETLTRARASDIQEALIAELQEHMLPMAPDRDHLEVAVRYKAAGASLGFGGDWYDVIEVDETTTAIVVGDVVGHGMEAAARMVVVRSAINAVVRLGTPLSDVFTVADPVINQAQATLIGTAVVLIVDTAAGVIHYTSAGHPPVLVCSPDGDIRRLDDANSIVLGIHDRVPIAGSAPFPPGSMAVAYTDGLVEARGEAIDEGIERIRTLLAVSHASGHDAQRTGDEMLTSVDDAADLTDDITLLVLRHTA